MWTYSNFISITICMILVSLVMSQILNVRCHRFYHCFHGFSDATRRYSIISDYAPRTMSLNQSEYVLVISSSGNVKVTFHLRYCCTLCINIKSLFYIVIEISLLSMSGALSIITNQHLTNINRNWYLTLQNHYNCIYKFVGIILTLLNKIPHWQ